MDYENLLQGSCITSEWYSKICGTPAISRRLEGKRSLPRRIDAYPGIRLNCHYAEPESARIRAQTVLPFPKYEYISLLGGGEIGERCSYCSRYVADCDIIEDARRHKINKMIANYRMLKQKLCKEGERREYKYLCLAHAINLTNPYLNPWLSICRTHMTVS